MSTNRRTENVQIVSRINTLVIGGTVATALTTSGSVDNLTVGGFVAAANRTTTGVYAISLSGQFPTFQTLIAELQAITSSTGIRATIVTSSAIAGTLTVHLTQQPSNSTVSALIDVAANAGNFINIFGLANNTSVTR